MEAIAEVLIAVVVVVELPTHQRLTTLSAGALTAVSDSLTPVVSETTAG